MGKHKRHKYSPLSFDTVPSSRTRSGRKYNCSSFKSKSASPLGMASVDFPQLIGSGSRFKSVNASCQTAVNPFSSLDLRSFPPGSLPLSGETSDLASPLSSMLGMSEGRWEIDNINVNEFLGLKTVQHSDERPIVSGSRDDHVFGNGSVDAVGCLPAQAPLCNLIIHPCQSDVQQNANSNSLTSVPDLPPTMMHVLQSDAAVGAFGTTDVDMLDVPCHLDVRHNANTKSMPPVHVTVPNSVHAHITHTAAGTSGAHSFLDDASMSPVTQFLVGGNRSVPASTKSRKIGDILTTVDDPAVASIAKPVEVATPGNWLSLFKTLPKNAGDFVPRSFVTIEDEGTMILPVEVLQAGIERWSDHLVGFFLDASPPYKDVKEHCLKIWKHQGRIKVYCIDSMFYFKFANKEDRLRVLEADPTIINGKPFIITPWSPTVHMAREQVLSIPVWALFTHIPTVLQSMIGLNWLASLVGNLKCFAANTVARDCLVYARALIEISPNKPLPSKLKVRIAEGQDVEVDVTYSWKPDICSSCKLFGHTFEKCMSKSPIPKVPLPRPVLKWVPKATNPAPPPFTPVVSASEHIRAFSDEAITSPVIDPLTASTVFADTVYLDSTMPPMSSDVQPDDIKWDPIEQALIHELSEMRYDPILHEFHMYVSDIHGESKRLFYSVDGKGLRLSTEGDLGALNEATLMDDSWDRKFIYCEESPDFVPNIMDFFAGYLHVIGPESTADGTCSSSSEEE